MAGYAAKAYEAENLDGHAHDLGPVSAASRFKLQMDSDDDVVKMTVDGGAWISIFASAGPVTTMQQAYDGGAAVGTGSGRSITQMDGGALVVTNSGANNNDTLQVNKTPSGAQSGDAILATTSATCTGAPIHVVAGASSNAASAANSGIYLHNQSSQLRSLSIKVRNKVAGSDGIIFVEWDTTNFEGAVANTTLTGETNMVVLDGQTNVSAGAQPVRGAWIKIPATTRANTAGEGALVIDSNATLARSLDIDAANTGGNIAVITASAGLSTSLIGWTVDFSGSTGTVQQQCYRGDTSAQSADTSIVFLATCNATAGASLGINRIQTGSQTLSASTTLIGIEVDLTGVTGNATQFIGPFVGRVAAGASSTSAVLYADWRGTSGNTIGIVHVTDANLASNLTGQLVGVGIDLTDTNHGNQSIVGCKIQVPATTRANTAGEAALVINSSATGQRAIDVAIAQTLTGTSIMHRFGTNVVMGGSTFVMHAITPGSTNTVELGSEFIGLNINLSSNVTPGAHRVTALNIVIPATTRASTDGEGALVINSDATAARVIDIDVANTSAISGGLVCLRWGASTQLSALTYGYVADFTTNIDLNNKQVHPYASYVGSGAGTLSACYLADYRGTAGSTAGAFFNAAVGASTTLTGTLTGMYLDLYSGGNLVPGAQAVTGLSILIPATTLLDNKGINLDLRHTRGIGFNLFYSSTTLGGPTTGISANLQTSVTGGTNAVVGYNCSLPNSSSASTVGYQVNCANSAGTMFSGSFNISTTLTGAFTGVRIDLGTSLTLSSQAVKSFSSTVGSNSAVDSASTSSSIFAADWRSRGGTQSGVIRASAEGSLTLSGQINAYVADLQTNITPGSNVLRGMYILTAAGTADNTAGNSVILVDSNCTTQRVLDIDCANTTGVVCNVRWGTATTLAAGNTFALNIDGTNVTVPTGTTFYGLYIQCPAGTNDVSAGIGVRCDNTNGNLAWRGIDVETTRTFTSSADNGTVGNHAFVFCYNAPVASGASTTLILRSPIIYVNHAPTTTASGTVTDTTTGIYITMTPASSAAVDGIYVTMSANCTGQGIEVAHAGSNAALQLTMTGTGRVLTASVTGAGGAENNYFVFDNSQTTSHTGSSGSTMRFTRPATISTGTESCSVGAVVRNSSHTGASTVSGAVLSVESAVATSAAITLTASGSVLSVSHVPSAGGGGTITDTTTGIAVTMTPAASSAVLGVSVTMSANATGAAYTATHSGTGLGLNISTSRTAGSLNQLITAAALTASSTVTGLAVDLTGFTAGLTNVFMGYQVYTPAGTAASAAGQGAIQVTSLLTRARSLDITVRNVSGTIIGVSYSSSPTLTAALTGIDLDFSGSSNPDQQVTALAVTIDTSSTSTQRVTHVTTENGATWTEGIWSELLTLSTSGATTNTTNSIPANSWIEGVTLRITTTIAGVNSTTLSLGDSVTAARFGTTGTLTSGTTITGLTHLQAAINSATTGAIVTTATTIRVTLSGGADNTPSAGAVRITVRYRTYVAETS